VLIPKWQALFFLLEDLTVNKRLLRNLFIFFNGFCFFAFWGEGKHVLHIAPFCPTRYVLKSFRYLEVSNLVRNWNKVNNFIFLGRNFNYANWKYQYSYTNFVSYFINKLVSILFCEFNREASWNKGKTIILVRSSFQIPN